MKKGQYTCNNCGARTFKWSGQCFDCNTWGSIEEEPLNMDNNSNYHYINKSSSVSPNCEILIEDFSSYVSDKLRITTPIDEFNRVLGGGLVQSSAILIGGDPGIGKSTLLLQICASLDNCGLKALYVTGEESTDQVKLRANRLGFTDMKSKIMSATNINDIIATIDKNKKIIDFLVIDSIQTIFSSEISSAPGTVSQIRAATHELITYIKKNNIILVIIGHVTKDGQIAGPKVLEHMMDTVLYFEGDSGYNFRILRSIKNRFGAVNEIGIFEMTSLGLKEIKNPSQLFLMDRERNISGSSIFAGIEGSRPILVEIQALITHSNVPMPRRSVVGWDANRLSMILAVLSVRYGLNLSAYEVYLSVAGGLKITEPAMDLAVASAIISSVTNKPLPYGSVFFGEIGLSGEVRRVNNTDVRIKESFKLGFDKVFCGSNQNEEFSTVEINHIKQLKNIIDHSA